jgi:hypothetical protein
MAQRLWHDFHGARIVEIRRVLEEDLLDSFLQTIDPGDGT